MDISHDRRIVMTLDAGGTNFVFTAMRGRDFVVPKLTLPSNGDDLGRCLATMVEGFSRVKEQCPEPPVAWSRLSAPKICWSSGRSSAAGRWSTVTSKRRPSE